MLWDYEGETFYQYAMSLFMEAGHVSTSTPEYYNHSAEQFVYFDNTSDSTLSQKERGDLKHINNISRLFTVNDCTFFSINLSVSRPERSELAHSIHTMIHPMFDTEGTICLFRFEEEVMLSFAGFGFRCILSDWYRMYDPYDELLRRIDIVNMSIENGRDFFYDFVYAIARNYYIFVQSNSIFEVIPIDSLTRLDREEVTREELDQLIRDEMHSDISRYGDDYVGYDETITVRKPNIDSSLDMMLLEMDAEPDNPFGEDIEDDDESGEDDLSLTPDKYEYEDIDPGVFQDPLLLVKLLRKQGQENSNLRVLTCL